MSSLIYTLYLKPSTPPAAAGIKAFVELINSNDYDAVRELDTEELLGELEHYFADPISFNKEGEVIKLESETASSFDIDMFAAFLKQLGATHIELSAYHTGVGEYSFFNDDEFYSSYEAAEWNWLPKPSEED